MISPEFRGASRVTPGNQNGFFGWLVASGSCRGDGRVSKRLSIAKRSGRLRQIPRNPSACQVRFGSRRGEYIPPQATIRYNSYVILQKEVLREKAIRPPALSTSSVGFKLKSSFLIQKLRNSALLFPKLNIC